MKHTTRRTSERVESALELYLLAPALIIIILVVLLG